MKKIVLFVLLGSSVALTGQTSAFDAPLPKGPGPLYGCTCPYTCILYKIMHMFGASVAPMQM